MSVYNFLKIFRILLVVVCASAFRCEADELQPSAFPSPCCTTMSYGSDPYSLRVRSPVGVDIKSCGAQMDSVSMDDVQKMLNDIADVTHLKFVINPNYKDASLRLSARISIIKVPGKRSDFDSYCANNLDDSYSFISKIKTNENGGTGLYGMIEVVYNKSVYAIAHARGTKNKSTIFDILIVKTVSIGMIKNLVYRAILEGIGYDADNSFISASIFDEGFRTDLTERDKAALRQLYSASTNE